MAKLLLSVLIAVLSLTAIVSAGPIPDEFKEIAPEMRETCMKQSGVTLELIEKAAKGDFTDDNSLKCYLKCIFDQFRLISTKGFNYEAMVAVSPPKMKDVAIKAVENCRDTTGKPDDQCDLAFNISKCFYNTVPDEYFII